MSGNPRITRRRFLYGLGIAAVAIALTRWSGNAGAARAFASRLVNRVYPPARRIRRHFAYLQFEPGTIDRFVADFERVIGSVPIRSTDLYTRFLLSTDFFQHGADQSRTLRYALFYEPSATPCYNPLSPPLA